MINLKAAASTIEDKKQSGRFGRDQTASHRLKTPQNAK